MYNSTGNRSPRASKRPFRFPVFIVSTFFVLFFILTVFPIHPGFPQIRSSTVRASFEPSSIEPTNDVSYKVKGIPSGPAATKLRYPEDYGTYGQFQSRTIVWVLAQQHNYLGSFVLGVLFLISVLEVRGMLIRDREATQQHDRVAYELLGIVLLALSIASITGGILLFGLLSLYPGLMRYLASILGPFFAMYGFLFLSISLTAYLYYQSWNRMERGNAKWVHAAIGVLANFFGILLMALANSWITFMMSPSGVDEHGRFLGSYWRVLHTPLWVSYSVHRFFVCILFGSAVVAGYAAYRAMTAKSQDEKSHYNWMSQVAFLTVVFSLITLPFGGYWVMRETYAYRQQMGITLLGGLLAWVGITLVNAVGLLFLGINYYVWQQIDHSADGNRYRIQAKIVLLILTVSFLIYITPHTIVMTPLELKKMGGAQHPVVGYYGVEGAKSTAINLIILTTIWSLLVWWRCRYRIASTARRIGSVLLAVLFLGGAANIVALGIYGFSMPANVRIGLSVPMVLSTLTALVFGCLITYSLVRRSERITFSWRPHSNLGNYALLFIAVVVTWIMGISGYIRSSVRLHWHVNEILRDNSPWAFTNPIGYAGNIVTLNVLIFWSGILVLFWLARLNDHTLKEKESFSEINLPGFPLPRD